MALPCTCGSKKAWRWSRPPLGAVLPSCSVPSCDVPPCRTTSKPLASEPFAAAPTDSRRDIAWDGWPGLGPWRHAAPLASKGTRPEPHRCLSILPVMVPVMVMGSPPLLKSGTSQPGKADSSTYIVEVFRLTLSAEERLSLTMMRSLTASPSRPGRCLA
jgi:hypothetical protein